MILVFDHVAYDTLQITLEDAFERDEFFLTPNLLQTNRIVVEAQKAKSEVSKDLPQSLTILSSVDFVGKGYIDAGDLLRIDQSIQVEEELSGKKTISMRGGNPEDVVVAYNGIKMNNNYDNVFDVSLIDLENVEQIEIIKGSNTALFGSDAFSGVVNIIPKTKPNYTARFVQKFGSYDNGDWSFQLNQSLFDKLHLSYNQRRAGSKRPYVDKKDLLENKTIHHSASMIYELSPENSINFLYMYSKLDYDNSRLFETIKDINQIGSLRYSGNIGPVNLLNLSIAYQSLDNSQFITTNTGAFDRQLFNKNYFINLEKTFDFDHISFLTAYQYENGSLDFDEDRSYMEGIPVGLESATLTLKKYGAVGIAKVKTPTGSEFLNEATLDLSARYDKVINQQRDVSERNGHNEIEFTPGLYRENNWKETTIKFSTELSGSGNDISYGVFLSTGNNVKFPTMFHQLSAPSQIESPQPAIIASLNPEYNKSTEIGLNVIRETPHIKTIDGWQVQLNYFTNLYENKFRTYYIPDVPVAFYDNVPNAEISGIESNGKVFFFDNKLTIELGASRFFISEKAAFPFKSDIKFIANMFLNYNGYSLKVNWFKESEQLGWFRTYINPLQEDPPDQFYQEVTLPGFSNIDIHLGKEFDLSYLKLNLNFSARNILNDDTVLEGIALRDRRFYIGFGLVY
jgi:outer membrane receptor protein involved in Fe transport